MRLLRGFRPVFFVFILLYLIPSLAAAGWWMSQERPHSWREANWTTSGVLSGKSGTPGIYVMAARTGGLKGSLSVHSWLVICKEGASSCDRYDKVGWGLPVRRNAYAPDARWYSNTPYVVKAVTGPDAQTLFGKVETVIAAYPYQQRGDYHIWPGPNSNSFVAHVLKSVPELDTVLPSNAVGRDWRPGFFSFELAPDGRNLHVTLGGLVGFAAGQRSGLEFHLLGLVAGIDIMHPAIKLPGIGRIDLWHSAA